MKNAPANFLVLAICAVFVAGCAVTPKEIAATQKEESIAIFQMESSINGKPAKGYSKYCIPEIKNVDTKADVKAKFFDDFSYVVLKSPPGKFQIDRFRCSENKIFYNRARRHTLKTPLSFQTDAGHVNYVGKVYMNYTPSSFSLGDVLLTGVGGYTDEEYRVTMKFTDDYEEAQKRFLKEYGTLPAGITFKKTLMEQVPAH